MIDLLADKFVNTWVLLVELEQPQESFKAQDARLWAKTALTNYDYPVDTLVISAAGEVLSQVSIEEVLSSSASLNTLYLERLKEALD